MTRLVVVGAPAGDDAADRAHAPGGRLAEELAEHLARQAGSVQVPVSDVAVATDVDGVRTALADAAAAGRPVGLVPADLVVHPTLLGDVLDDPRRPVAALVLDDGRLAALRVDPDAAAAAARELGTGSDPADRPHTCPEDAVLAALARAGVPVARLTPGRLFARRPGVAGPDRDAALLSLSGSDEHRARLAGAARPADGFYSTFVVRRLSKHLTGVAVRLGATPNGVTLLSLVIGLGAAALLTSPGLPARVLGAVLLQVSLVVDCVDGELARYTRRFTPLGAWLDGVGDRVKEYAVLAALAVAAPGRAAWLLAVAGLVVMTYRHVVDHHFMRRLRAGDPPPAPGLAPAVAVPRETATTWLRRVLQWPVGERWLLVSVLVVLAGPTVTLAVFAAAAALSAVWTSGGRLLRARRFPGGASERLGWLVPGVRWVVEAAVVVAAFAWRRPDDLWLAYALLAVVAYHGYDTVYRRAYRVPGTPAAVNAAGLGHEGRALAVAVTALAGSTVLWATTAVLTVGLALLFGGESLDAWLRWLKARPSIEEEA